MPVVTIRGTEGSGAEQIGRMVASQLQGGYVDSEIITQVASRLRMTPLDVTMKESPHSTLLERLGNAIGRVGAATFAPDSRMGSQDIPPQPDDMKYVQALTAVIKDLAHAPSIVIRGRGSHLILKDHPTAVHVLVVAPLDVRVKRFTQVQPMPREEAIKEMEWVDSRRREFVRRYFRVSWDDPEYYDVVMNTGKVSFERAAQFISQLAVAQAKQS